MRTVGKVAARNSRFGRRFFALFVNGVTYAARSNVFRISRPSYATVAVLFRSGRKRYVIVFANGPDGDKIAVFGEKGHVVSYIVEIIDKTVAIERFYNRTFLRRLFFEFIDDRLVSAFVEAHKIIDDKLADKTPSDKP